MINKIVLGLAQSEKNYGLKKNNNIEEVLKEIDKYNILNLDTSLSYKYSYKHLKNKNLNNYNLSIKLPKIFNRENISKKVIQSLEEIFAKYNIKKFDTLLLHDPILPLEKEWKIIEKILINYKKKIKLKILVFRFIINLN